MQSWLAWIISAPEGVYKALRAPAAPGRRGRSARGVPRDCSAYIAELPPISKARRLDIYSFAYFERLMEAVCDDFEATYRCAGDRAFRKMLREYLERHPSRHHTVSWVGSDLPEFLGRHPLSRKHPEIVDLARLDWAFLSALFARNSEVWDPATLEKLKPAAWEKLRFKVGPSVTLIRSDWLIARFWKTHRKPVRRAPRGGSFTLVHRAGFCAQVVELTPHQHAFLTAASKGETLGRILGKKGMQDQPVGEWLKDWAATGVLRPSLKRK